MEFEDILELKENLIQGKFSNLVIRKYIELSTHLIYTEEILAAKKLLQTIGFTKKSINKFVKLAKVNAERYVSEDFKLMLKGKISKKYLN